jgi:hypothetical protein
MSRVGIMMFETLGDTLPTIIASLRARHPNLEVMVFASRGEHGDPAPRAWNLSCRRSAAAAAARGNPGRARHRGGRDDRHRPVAALVRGPVRGLAQPAHDRLSDAWTRQALRFRHRCPIGTMCTKSRTSRLCSVRSPESIGCRLRARSSVPDRYRPALTCPVRGWCATRGRADSMPPPGNGRRTGRSWRWGCSEKLWRSIESSDGIAR